MDPDEVLLDPPSDQVSLVEATDTGLEIIEITVPTGIDTGMDPVVCGLRQLASRLQEEADAGRPRAVHSLTVTYERDPFHLVQLVAIHGPTADQN